MSTATSNKITTVPAEFRPAVRDGLRAARDLMNDSGAHWIQNNFKRQLDIMVPSGKTGPDGEPILERVDGVFGWCAIGGLQEIIKVEGVRAYCIVVLVERGLPEPEREAYYRECKHQLENEQSDWDYERAQWPDDDWKSERPTQLNVDSKAGVAHDIVTGWNDYDNRTWDEVSAAFRSAASRVRV